jgi:DNA polymerase-3 subunit epsilon
MEMFCIFDTETGGLDPKKHALLTVAFVMKPDLDKEYIACKQEFRMNPGEYEVTDGALAVNGYTREEIAGWPDRVKTTESIRRFLEDWGRMGKFEPVGHNLAFDKGFLLQVLPEHFYNTYFNHRFLDSMIVTNFLNLARPGFSEGSSLKHLRAKYGIELAGSHEATKDAVDTAEVMRRLIQEVKV